VKTRKYDRMLYEHISQVECIAISHDGRWCAMGTRRGVKVFDRTTGGEKAEGRTGLARADSLAFSPDGKRVIATVHPGASPAGLMDWRVRFWDWQTETPPTSVICPMSPEQSKAWQGKGSFRTQLMSNDGKRFLSILGTHGLLLLDLKNPDPKPEEVPKGKDAKK
jgi:WD40 repeat protein